MTAAVKTKKTDLDTGLLNVTYSNETKIRNCTREDFTKTIFNFIFNYYSNIENLPS